jgi:very-short-patch-repair endonuclease
VVCTARVPPGTIRLMPASKHHPVPNADHPVPHARHPEPNAGKETGRPAGFPSPRVDRDRSMTRRLRANHSVTTIRQLHALGFTEDDVRGFVAHGDLRRVHRGVYADGRTQLSDHGRLHAALLALGRGAWLPGATAAAAWGLERGVPALIEVALVANHTPRHPGLRVRRVVRPPHPSEIRSTRGLRVSSIPRLLVESAATGATTDDLHELLEAAARRNLLNVEDLKATLDRNAGRKGAARVRRAAADYLPHPQRKSKFEQSFDRWLARHPEIPEPQRNVRLGPWEIDCYWPGYRLVLELDGREFHIAAQDFERDRLKDAWLQLNGNRVLRITWRRWRHDRPGAENDLNTMLTLGQSRADRAVAA